MTGLGVTERINLILKGVAKIRALTPRAKQLQARYDSAYQDVKALVKQFRLSVKDPNGSVRNNYEFFKLQENLSSAVVKLIALRRHMSNQGLCSQKEVQKLERKLNRLVKRLTVRAEVKRHNEIIKSISLIDQLRHAGNERIRLLEQIEALEPKPENAATILGLKKAAHEALGRLIAAHEQLPDNAVDFPIQIERARQEYQETPEPKVRSNYKAQRLANFQLRLKGIDVPTEPSVPYVGNSESELIPIEQPVEEPAATPAAAPQVDPQPPASATPIDIKRKALMPEFTREDIREMVDLLKQGALDPRLIRFLQLNQMIDGRFYSQPDFTALFLLENAHWILESLDFHYEQAMQNGQPEDFAEFRPLLTHPLLTKAITIRKRHFAETFSPAMRAARELQEAARQKVETELERIARAREIDNMLEIQSEEDLAELVAFKSELENSLVMPETDLAIDNLLPPVSFLDNIWSTTLREFILGRAEARSPDMRRNIYLFNTAWQSLSDREKLEIAGTLKRAGQEFSVENVLPHLRVNPDLLRPTPPAVAPVVEDPVAAPEPSPTALQAKQIVSDQVIDKDIYAFTQMRKPMKGGIVQRIAAAKQLWQKLEVAQKEQLVASLLEQGLAITFENLILHLPGEFYASAQGELLSFLQTLSEIGIGLGLKKPIVIQEPSTQASNIAPSDHQVPIAQAGAEATLPPPANMPNLEPNAAPVAPSALPQAKTAVEALTKYIDEDLSYVQKLHLGAFLCKNGFGDRISVVRSQDKAKILLERTSEIIECFAGASEDANIIDLSESGLLEMVLEVKMRFGLQSTQPVPASNEDSGVYRFGVRVRKATLPPDAQVA